MCGEFDYYITLTDKNGYETELLWLDRISFNGNDYVVFMPVEDYDKQVVILQLVEHEARDEYLSVEDNRLLAKIFEEFKTRNDDCFIFTDEYDDDY